METKLEERDLITTLPEVLERVRHGERFVVVRAGERLAVLSPPKPPGITGRELIAKIGHLKMPGDGFADDIEAARASLLPTSMPQWPD